MADNVLHRNINMLAIMEQDLVDKVKAAFAANPEVELDVYGVFDLDELERLQESSFRNQLAVGVGYLGAERLGSESSNISTGFARTLNYNFIVLLAVPTSDSGATRYSATRLLTVIRNSIMGTRISNDTLQRQWSIVREKPEIGESNRNMLLRITVRSRVAE